MKRPGLCLLLFFVFACAFFPAHSQAASFNCVKAATPPEKMICADAELSAADSDLMIAYKKALNSTSKVEELREEQRKWMDQRDNCATLACMKRPIKIGRWNWKNCGQPFRLLKTSRFKMPQSDTISM
jgi:uncharacterized protein